jgi:hypothetical protein
MHSCLSQRKDECAMLAIGALSNIVASAALYAFLRNTQLVLTAATMPSVIL